MIVEYLDTGSGDCPLIRIFGTSKRSFRSLFEIAKQLSRGEKVAADILQLPDFIGIGVTHFVLKRSKRLANVHLTGAGGFTWASPPPEWSSIAQLIEPFAQEPRMGAFQWLAGPEARHGLDATDIGIVLSFSPDGQW